jgi:signal transduction histidine kinase
LLVVGFVASGVLARRLARPLQRLAAGAESLGRGELGVQVPESSGGEVGGLERAFNEMSVRLEKLEQERTQWRQREHLAELGDLARGLAHTLRNPLNTLGLVVDELSGAAGDSEQGAQLVATARGQIRRIDHWLRSFLAVGAGQAAERDAVDLGGLVQEVALEAIQQGAEVGLDIGSDSAPVRVVPTAIRAALSNLLENAVDASPEGTQVRVEIGRGQTEARVGIRDSGPGLPEEVRERLFSPHVTTKVEGSGMGLFLARQLIVNMHGGRLEVADADGGGTSVTVVLPLARPVEEG